MPAISRESDFGETSTPLELHWKLLGKFPVGTGVLEVLEVVEWAGVEDGDGAEVVVGVSVVVGVVDPGRHCE